MAARASGQKILYLLAALSISVSAASGSILPARGPVTNFIPSFDISVQGLGQASFYTFQQLLPHPTLPYATQDEWVQYVYPDGSAAVYNVARLGASTGVAGRGARGVASQPCVAVKPGVIAEIAEWFHRQYTVDSMANEKQPLFVKDEQQLRLQLEEPEDDVRIPQHAQQLNTVGGFDLVAQGAMTAAEPNTCAHRTFQLYLGMSIPLKSGGGLVSKQQLEAFLQAEVSPRVPGFTVLLGTGFWQGESEPVAVLEVVSSEATIAEAVAEIAKAYKGLFGQEAVLLKEVACPAAVQMM